MQRWPKSLQNASHRISALDLHHKEISHYQLLHPVGQFCVVIFSVLSQFSFHYLISLVFLLFADSGDLQQLVTVCYESCLQMIMFQLNDTKLLAFMG